jgi:parallel beta-helix repeat protein
MSNLITPTDGMTITEDVTFAPGVYSLPNGLNIAADNVTIDGTGALLVGQEHTGNGIHAENHNNITIRGLAISGYYHGIRMEHCKSINIEDVRIRDTAEIENIDTFLFLWHPLDKVYSGAILFNDVQGGAVRNCDLQHQMNGVLLYGCSGLTIEHNNASFNSGWGVYLSNSSDNEVNDNRLDFCNRVFRRPESGLIRVEADAAGIVLVYSSSRNKFLRNSCMCGGDGIFVAGYDHKGNQGACNDNLFEENDCRYSSNNAIESTFSKGNIFRRNDCSRSNYGFWMGYSWDNVMEDNIIEFNHVVGIAIEHGHHFTIRNNKITHNDEGIRLWTRGGDVVQYWPGHEVSHDFTLEDNLIELNNTGFYGYTGDETTDSQCNQFHLRKNTICDNRVGLRFARVDNCTVEDNTFTNNVEVAVKLAADADVAIGENSFDGNAADVVKS